MSGEVLARLDAALSGALATRQELALRPRGEALTLIPMNISWAVRS